MHWIDIVFIAIIVIFAIIGLAKGFFDSLLSLFASVASIFLAFWASKPVAAFLNKLVDVNGFFEKLLLKAGVSSSGIAGHSLSQLASICTIIASMIIVYLLIKVAVWLLARLFDSATANSTALSGMNRLFGLLFGALQGFAMVLILLGLTSIASYIPSVETKVNDFLADSKITRGTYSYVNEWVNNELYQKLNEFVDSLADPNTPAPTVTVETAWNTAKDQLADLTSDDITVVYSDIAENVYDATVKAPASFEVSGFTVEYHWSVTSLTIDTTPVTGKDTINSTTGFVELSDLTPETIYTLTLSCYITLTSGETSNTSLATPTSFTFSIAKSAS